MIRHLDPWLGEEEKKQLIEVIDSKYLKEKTKTKEFEEKFSALTKAPHSIAYCNGTMTLFAALKALNIGEGDEVIVPNITFIATANAVILSGAKPVFCDIEPKTYQISPEEISSHITDKTKAIMPVHLYGQSADMDAIMKLASKHNLKVIEDAAQALGTTFNGKHVGTFGDFGSFSFLSNKTITTGEGGMLITSSPELSKKVSTLKNHGRVERGTFLHEEIGYNFCITELQSALGVAQMNKFPEIQRRKKAIRDYYKKELSSLPQIEVSPSDPRSDPTPWFSTITVPDAEALHAHLTKNEIMTWRIYLPLHLQPCYKNFVFNESFPNSIHAYEHVLTLPSSVVLTEPQLEQVVKVIKEFYK